MILLAYDIESTGLDLQKDRTIEVGLALYSTGQHKILESSSFLVQSDGVPITSEITELTGTTQAAADRYGYDVQSAIEDIGDWIAKADHVMAHNGKRFDQPMTENWAKRASVTLPTKTWIDPYTDIPGVKGEQLITMCARKGILIPNLHSALDDAKGMLAMVIEHVGDGITLESIVERAKSPLVLLQSHQNRNDNDAAKKLKFRWNPDNKIWWKAVKELDVQEIVNQATFGISRLDKEYTLEDLET